MDLRKLSKDVTIEICASMTENYEFFGKIGEGTYGEVYKGYDKEGKRTVAMKRLKKEQGHKISEISIREINIFQKAQHDNVATFRKIIFADNNIYVLMDFIPTDLWVLINRMNARSLKFGPWQIQRLMFQLVTGVAHLHGLSIFHRDLKPSNLLITTDGVLKICDFGMAAEFGTTQKNQAHSPMVITRWYRAPEVLLSYGKYGAPIDVWSIGCIFAEISLMRVFFPGNSEIDQIHKIFEVMGTPSESVIKRYNNSSIIQKVNFAQYRKTNLNSIFDSLSHFGVDLLSKTLKYHSNERITAEEALKHQYFKIPILPTVPSTLPSCRNEMKTPREKRELECTELQSEDQSSLKRAVKRKKEAQEIK